MTKFTAGINFSGARVWERLHFVYPVLFKVVLMVLFWLVYFAINNTGAGGGVGAVPLCE